MSRAEVTFNAYPRKDVHSFVSIGAGVRPVYLYLGDQDGGEGTLVALTPEEVYTLVDLWTANVKRPEPPKPEKTAWDHYLELPDGAKFTVGNATLAYTKSGAYIRWPSDQVLAVSVRGAWSKREYDLIKEYTPSNRDLFDALPTPSTFWLKIDDEWYERIKVSDSRYFSPEIPDMTMSADYLEDYSALATEDPNE